MIVCSLIVWLFGLKEMFAERTIKTSWSDKILHRIFQDHSENRASWNLKILCTTEFFHDLVITSTWQRIISSSEYLLLSFIVRFQELWSFVAFLLIIRGPISELFTWLIPDWSKTFATFQTNQFSFKRKQVSKATIEYHNNKLCPSIITSPTLNILVERKQQLLARHNSFQHSPCKSFTWWYFRCPSRWNNPMD